MIETQEILALFVRHMRAKRGLTQMDLAIASKVSLPTVQNIERPGARRPSPRMMMKIAKGLDIDGEEFVAKYARDESASEFSKLSTTPTLYPIPTYDLSASASHWVELADAEDQSREVDPRVIDQGLFRIFIHKDCMEPRWHDGDCIEFRVWREGKEPPPIGKDVVVTNSDGMTTFKRLVSMDEDEIVLKPLNAKKYPKEIRLARQMMTRMAVALHAIDVRPE